MVVSRPEFVYGPGDRHAFCLFRTIRKRRFHLIDGSGAVWHPTYVGDLTGGRVLCLKNPEAVGHAYLMAGKMYATIKEFSSLITDALSVPRPSFSVSKGFCLLLARAMERAAGVFGINPPLTPSRVGTFCRSSSCSIGKAARDLSYRPGGQPGRMHQ